MMEKTVYRLLCRCAVFGVLLVLSALAIKESRVAFRWFRVAYNEPYRLSPHTSPFAFDILVAPAQRLLFCAIEKNANTAFNDLLCSLARARGRPPSLWQRVEAGWLRAPKGFELGCTWGGANYAGVGMKEAELWDALSSAEWSHAVFVRDPIERFVSGYLSKCAPGHDSDRYICERVFGARNASLAQAVAVLAAAAREGRDLPGGVPQDHFRLQSRFCNGAVGAGKFELMYELDPATSRDNVADMLQHVGVDEPALATPAFEAHFPPPAKLKLHATQHDTNAHNRSRALLEREADGRNLMRALLAFYAPDYRALASVLSVPRWAADLAGDEWVAGYINWSR